MDGVKVEAGQPGASEVLDTEYDTVIDYLQHYEAAHGVRLPVRYDLCVCASKGRAGHEATEVADWIGYLPEHGDEHKDAYQLAHPVTAISDDGSAVTPSILEQVFENVKESGLYLIEHCEHHDTGAVNDGPVSRKLGVPGIPEARNSKSSNATLTCPAKPACTCTSSTSAPRFPSTPSAKPRPKDFRSPARPRRITSH